MSQRKTTMYKGQQVETIDCTPTWKAASQIYLAVIEQEARNDNHFSEAMKNARAGIYEMAGHLDKFNAASKKREEDNWNELLTGTIISTQGTFTFQAIVGKGKYLIIMTADHSYTVGEFDAYNNSIKFTDELQLTMSALVELSATGNAMNSFYKS